MFKSGDKVRIIEDCFKYKMRDRRYLIVSHIKKDSWGQDYIWVVIDNKDIKYPSKFPFFPRELEKVDDEQLQFCFMEE